MATKYLDYAGLSHLTDKIKAELETKVDKVSGKGLSTNDLTAALKSNYDAAYTHSQAAHAPSDAEKNTIVSVKKNGTAVSIGSDRSVNITVPTTVAELTDASSYVTDSELSTQVGTLNDSIATKVDKVDGKGLSENDFTDTLLSKLNGIEAGANKYTLPTANGSTKGGVTLSDATNSTSGASAGVAATPAAVKSAYDKATSAETAITNHAADDDIHVTTEDKTRWDNAAAKTLPDATDSVAGIVKLSDATNGTQDTTGKTAATPKAVAAVQTYAQGVNDYATTHALDTTVHITSTERTRWNNTYTKTETYTKSEADSAIATAVAGASHLKRTIVDTLPAVGSADANTIYMVLEDSSSSDNKYVEWMVINGAWEKTGDTDVDLTDYMKMADIVSITNSEIDTLWA